MKTKIELNEELVKEALSLTDFQTEKELIEFALQELIRTRRKKRNLPAEAIGAIHTSNNCKEAIASTKDAGSIPILKKTKNLTIFVSLFSVLVEQLTTNN